MEQMNWTEIILGVFTLLSTCGWFVSGRKHRQEVESLKADVRQKDKVGFRFQVSGFKNQGIRSGSEWWSLYTTP
jgi:hypothetical protein